MWAKTLPATGFSNIVRHAVAESSATAIESTPICFWLVHRAFMLADHSWATVSNSSNILIQMTVTSWRGGCSGEVHAEFPRV